MFRFSSTDFDVFAGIALQGQNNITRVFLGTREITSNIGVYFPETIKIKIRQFIRGCVADAIKNEQVFGSQFYGRSIRIDGVTDVSFTRIAGLDDVTNQTHNTCFIRLDPQFTEKTKLDEEDNSLYFVVFFGGNKIAFCLQAELDDGLPVEFSIRQLNQSDWGNRKIGMCQYKFKDVGNVALTPLSFKDSEVSYTPPAAILTDSSYTPNADENLKILLWGESSSKFKEYSTANRWFLGYTPLLSRLHVHASKDGDNIVIYTWGTKITIEPNGNETVDTYPNISLAQSGYLWSGEGIFENGRTYEDYRLFVSLRSETLSIDGWGNNTRKTPGAEEAIPDYIGGAFNYQYEVGTNIWSNWTDSPYEGEITYGEASSPPDAQAANAYGLGVKTYSLPYNLEGALYVPQFRQEDGYDIVEQRLINYAVSYDVTTLVFGGWAPGMPANVTFPEATIAHLIDTGTIACDGFPTCTVKTAATGAVQGQIFFGTMLNFPPNPAEINNFARMWVTGDIADWMWIKNPEYISPTYAEDGVSSYAEYKIYAATPYMDTPLECPIYTYDSGYPNVDRAIYLDNTDQLEGWLHVSNGKHYFQGYLLRSLLDSIYTSAPNGLPIQLIKEQYLYFDGNPINVLPDLAEAIGCAESDIQCMMMDFPEKMLKRLM